MKRFYKFLMPLVAIVAMALPWNARAQEIVTIGTGTSTSYYVPFNSLYGYSFSEWVYSAADINMAGNITKISFYLGTSNSEAQTNSYTVWMKNVSRSSFSSASDIETVTASDVVFNGSWTIPANYTGWVELELDTPFEYDGSSNLMIAVHEYTSGYSSRYFTYTSVTGCGVQLYSDSYNPDPYNPSSYSGSSTTRAYMPNIQMEITTGDITCNRVRNLTATDIAPWSCTLNWVDTLNSGASYTVITMPDSTLMASGISDTTVSITGLTPDHNYVFGVIADCGGGDESRATTVNVHTLVSCPPPTALTVDGVTTSDISLHWTPGYQEAEWYLSIGDSLIGSVTDTSYTISDLNANTVYTIYLRAVCGADDSSVVVSTHTRTLPGEPVSEFPYTCGFEDAEENAGWVLENGTQPNAWYIGTAVNNGGTQSLYVSNNNGTSNAYDNSTASHVYAYRYINFSDTGAYAFSFDWRCEGESHYYDYLRAWLVPASVIHEAGDGTTYNYSTLAVPGSIDLVGANSNGQYTLAQTSNFTTHAGEFRISTPGTYKLVFLWSNDGSGGSNPPAAVDNVFINVNSCPAPYNLTVDYVSSDSITVSWTAGGEESGWLVSLNGGTPESVSATTYTFENLSANTTYNITVQADCGGEDVSIPASVSTRTACGTMSLPLNEDFNSYASSSYPSCWTRVMSGSYPYVTTSYGVSIQFAGTAAVIAPYIAAPLNQMLVSFDLRKEGSSSGQMTFGYTSDPVAASDMVVLQTIDPATTATYYHYEYDLSLDTNLTNLDPDSVYYLVWRQSSTATNWYYWLDNVLVEQVNPCTKPDNFVVNGAIADSVVAQWTEMGEATAWQLFVGPVGATPDADSAIDVSATSYVFTNLAGGVAYDMYVRSDCGGDYSNWRGPVSVTPGSYIMGSGNATITMCGGAIYDDGGPNGDYANSFDGMVTIYPAAADSMLTFYGTLAHESCCDHLYIYEGVGDGGNLLWSDGSISTSQTIPLDTCVSGPITIKWHSDGSSVNAGFEIFVNCVAAPQCSPVEALTVNTTPTAALVTWQPGFYGTYSGATVEYKVDTVETWTALPAVTGTYAIITGLDAATNYNLRVTTDCEGIPGGVALANFSTSNYGCLVADSATSRSVTVGTGSSTSSYFPTYSCYNYSLTEQVFTPTELGGAGNLVSLTMTPTSVVSANRNVEIYLGHVSTSTLSNFVYPSDLTLVYTGTTNLVANTPYTFTLDNSFSYNGSDNLLVLFRDMTGNYNCSNNWAVTSTTSGVSRYAYQDDAPYSLGYTGGTSSSNRANTTFEFLSCQTYGTCAAPAVAVTEVTTTTATVVWAPGSGETSWNLSYRMAGDANWSAPVAVTGNTYTVSGLTQGRRYEFRVENTCTEGNFAGTAQATLLCAQISDLPFTENFNGWGTGVTPNCWSNAGSYSPTSYGIISSSYNHSGSTGGSIYMYSSSTLSNKTYLTLPELDTLTYQPNQLQLVFSLFYTSSSYGRPAVEVGVMSDPANVSSFVVVDTVQHSGALSTWETFEVPMANYTGNGAYVAMRTAFDSAYSYFYLDDLTLEVIPTCPRPDSLTASNATTTTIDLGWHERSSASQWIVEYGPRGFELGTGTTVTANSNPFTLTGLPSSFQGEYYVKSICAVGDTSEYSRMACAFGTTQIPATLPYNYDFENATEWANWQTSTNHATADWYRGTDVADSGSYSMYVANSDSGYFNYSFSAVVNAAAYRDIDFGPVDSSYTISFRARAGGTTTNSYDGLGVYLVDPSIATVPSNNNITSPWGNVNDLYWIASVRLDTTWQTYTASFDTISGVQRVAFFWFNQNTGASYTNIPQAAAVDNIHINYSSCVRPVDLEATFVGSTTATLTWTGAAGANYEVTYREVGGTNMTAMATTNSITLTGLESNTTYRAWVRKICGAGDTSLYCDGTEFMTTMCDGGTEVLNYDPSTSATTSSYSPIGYATYNYSYVQTIIDSADLASLGGDITAFGFMPTNTTSSDYYTNMTMYMANVSESDLSSGFIHPDATHIFHKVIDSANFNFTNANEWQIHNLDSAFTWDGHSNLLIAVNREHGTWTSSGSFSAHAATASKMRYIYQDSGPYDINTVSDGTASSTVGDIRLISCGGTITCDAPDIDTAIVGETEVTLQWTGSAASYEVAAMEGTWSEPIIGEPATGNTATITGLTPATTYTVGVRGVCGEGRYSDWTVTTITTEAHPCYAPTNVTATNPTFDGATIAWTVGEEGQSNFEIHITAAGVDTLFATTSNPVTVTGLPSATAYTVTVRAICGEGDYSEWSTPANFSTATCQMAEGVRASATTATTATITWTANGSSSYEVAYGITGTSRENCRRLTANTNSITINGLDEATTYDVYVRSVCAAGVTSDWSDVVTFETQDVAIDDVDNASISLYPNPASSTVTLTGIEGDATVTVVDMNGREVYTQALKQSSNQTITIDVTGYAQGAYFVRITGDRVNAIRKLIVR